MRKKARTPLKRTDKRIFIFVRKSLKNRRIPPTVREIAKYLEISLGAAHRHLQKLRDNGLLKFRYGKKQRVTRGIKIGTNVPFL